MLNHGSDQWINRLVLEKIQLCHRINQSVGTIEIRKCSLLLLRECINKLVRLGDLSLAHGTNLFLGECLDLFFAKIIQRSWL